MVLGMARAVVPHANEVQVSDVVEQSQAPGSAAGNTNGSAAPPADVQQLQSLLSRSGHEALNQFRKNPVNSQCVRGVVHVILDGDFRVE